MVVRGRRLLMLATGVVVTCLLAAGVMPAAVRAAVSRQDARQVPVLDWRSCDGGFQCATARVPLDYRHPHGTMISIAVIRHLATDPRTAWERCSPTAAVLPSRSRASSPVFRLSRPP
jgi:hypothetical protein